MQDYLLDDAGGVVSVVVTSRKALSARNSEIGRESRRICKRKKTVEESSWARKARSLTVLF